MFELFDFVWPFSLVFGAVLGQKRGLWGTKRAALGGHPPTWRPRPGAPLVSFWLKIWIWRGHHLGSMRQSNGQNGKEKCLLACLSLLACC